MKGVIGSAGLSLFMVISAAEPQTTPQGMVISAAEPQTTPQGKSKYNFQGNLPVPKTFRVGRLSLISLWSHER